VFIEEMPNGLTYLISIFLGLIVGSFLNVVIARVPEKRSIVTPGSQCPHCKYKLRWYDNIPIVSFLLLRARCRKCHKSISPRYPLVELITAVLFLAVRMKFGWSYVLLIHDWPFVSLLVAITFIDLDHRIIPDPLSLGGLVLGVATAYFVPELGLKSSIAGAAIGFCVFYGLAWLYQKLAGRSGLGGGDIKFLAMLGSFLGPTGVFTSILISSIFGSLIGITWGMIQKRKNLMTVAIPFGPFLVVGALFHYLLSDQIWFRFMIPM
jgi:leader peptidase (prepilin peptidase) / N-methyltransferase